MTKDVFIKEVRDAEAMLYHISKSILKNDSDCGDAVQETILKAYEKLPTLKKEKYFRTWITKILINECNGILRKRLMQREFFLRICSCCVQRQSIFLLEESLCGCLLFYPGRGMGLG